MHLQDNHNAGIGDTWDIDSFQVQCRYKSAMSRWCRLGDRPTLEAARQAIVEHKQPNPILDEMVGRSPECEYRIIHRKGICTMLE